MPRPATPAVLTPAQFTKIGRALFGQTWQTELARQLDVDPSRIRQLADGRRKVNREIAKQLARICKQRSGRLMSLENSIWDALLRDEKRQS